MWRLKEKKWWEWSKEYRRWSLHPNYCWSEMKGEGCRHAEQSIHPVTQDSSHPLSISKCSQKKSSSILILKYDYSHTVRHWRWRAHHSFFLQYIYRLSECTAVKWICTQILTIKGIITQNLTKLYNEQICRTLQSSTMTCLPFSKVKHLRTGSGAVHLADEV